MGMTRRKIGTGPRSQRRWYITIYPTGEQRNRKWVLRPPSPIRVFLKGFLQGGDTWKRSPTMP